MGIRQKPISHPLEVVAGASGRSANDHQAPPQKIECYEATCDCPTQAVQSGKQRTLERHLSTGRLSSLIFARVRIARVHRNLVTVRKGKFRGLMDGNNHPFWRPGRTSGKLESIKRIAENLLTPFRILNSSAKWFPQSVVHSQSARRDRVRILCG